MYGISWNLLAGKKNRADSRGLGSRITLMLTTSFEFLCCCFVPWLWLIARFADACRLAKAGACFSATRQKIAAFAAMTIEGGQMTSGGAEKSRRSVSRVLSTSCDAGRPFLWDRRCRRPRATNPGGGSEMLPHPCVATRCRPPLFGLAPGGVYPASPVTRAAVRSYRTVSPLPATRSRGTGGLVSVALSLGSPPPAVSRHRISVEPGLSSTRF